VVLARHTATRPTASAARGSAAALLGEPAAARHRRTETTGKRRLTGAETAARCDGDGRVRRGGRQWSGRRGFGPRRSGRALSGRWLGQDSGARGEAAVDERQARGAGNGRAQRAGNGRARSARRAVLTAA
jgi:hypothetical protein